MQSGFATLRFVLVESLTHQLSTPLRNLLRQGVVRDFAIGIEWHLHQYIGLA